MGAGTGQQTLADTDFENYAGGDYRPAVGGTLENTGMDNSALYTNDILGNTRVAPFDIGAYELVGAGPVDSNLLEGDSFTTLVSVTFDGPSVGDMLGTVQSDFGSQPGDMATRFTGANSYHLSPESSSLPIGLYVNAATGDIEGTPDSHLGSPHTGVIVRGSAEPYHILDVGQSGNDFGYESLNVGDLTPKFVNGVEVITVYGNSVSGVVLVQTDANVPLFGDSSILLSVDGALANPYQIDPLGPGLGFYQTVHTTLASHIAGAVGQTLNLTITEASTGPDPVQQQTLWQDFAVGGNSGSLTYPVTPTSGNLLISALTVDKDSGAITIPAGWTIIGTTEFGNTVSGAFAYKISDGTEGAVAWNWTNSEASHVIWISEYSGVSELDVFAEADSADADVTSQTTGTTPANTADNSLAVAIWGADTSNNVSTGQAYSNGFTDIHPFDPGALAGMAIATKILTGTAAVESTFSATDSGDAMYGKVAVFK